MEQTLSIIKPDGLKNNITGKINSLIEDKGLKIVAQKMLHLSKKQAQNFYFIHKDRPFFNDLVNFMTSGPVIVQVLRGENAVVRYRNVMGATDPSQAESGTIRRKFSKNIDENTVHGSDSLENAKIEIAFFFSKTEIH